jgi:ribosome biogenesis GTPase A
VKPRFLIDENLDPDIYEGVKRYNSVIDIVVVGDDAAPPLGTKNPQILEYCEREQRILVTNNRKSMPGHLRDHLRIGHHYWGS